MKKSGMRGATLPKDHWEKDYECLDVAKEKYAGEFSNPEELKRNADALASYVKTHKVKR